jgi:hypothetical protein
MLLARLGVIKQEEALACVNHEIADVDRWEQAHCNEDKVRNKVKAAKKRYEDALRKKFFGDASPQFSLKTFFNSVLTASFEAWVGPGE